MTHRLYTLHAHAAIHAGTGQGAGLIDLPIARERATDHPILPGSSFKGALRDRFATRHNETTLERDDLKKSKTWAVFGPDTQSASDHAGGLQISDARALLFPVRCERGTFAWVTCPLTLQRLARDSGGLFKLDKPLTVEKNEEALITSKSALRHGQENLNVGGLTLTVRDATLSDSLADKLAELMFEPKDNEYNDWRKTLKECLCVVHDDTFTWMVTHLTELRARVSIDHGRGTARDGALWTEELLPAETVLAGVMRLEPVKTKHSVEALWAALEEATEAPMFVGGKVSVGHGVVQARLSGGRHGRS